MNSILVSVVMVLGLVVFDNINTSLIIYGSFLNSYRAGIDFKRQILTSEADPRAVRINFL